MAVEVPANILRSPAIQDLFSIIREFPDDGTVPCIEISAGSLSAALLESNGWATMKLNFPHSNNIEDVEVDKAQLIKASRDALPGSSIRVSSDMIEYATPQGRVAVRNRFPYQAASPSHITWFNAVYSIADFNSLRTSLLWATRALGNGSGPTSGVCFDFQRGNIVATDGIRLLVLPSFQGGKPFQAILPPYEFRKIPERWESLVLGNDHARIDFHIASSGYEGSFAMSLVAGPYPDYQANIVDQLHVSNNPILISDISDFRHTILGGLRKREFQTDYLTLRARSIDLSVTNPVGKGFYWPAKLYDNQEKRINLRRKDVLFAAHIEFPFLWLPLNGGPAVFTPGRNLDGSLLVTMPVRTLT